MQGIILNPEDICKEHERFKVYEVEEDDREIDNTVLLNEDCSDISWWYGAPETILLNLSD